MKTNTNENVVHPNLDAIATGAHQAVDWAANAANAASDGVNSAGHEARDKQERWLENARSYVQEHPATAITIALAGGYFISRILSARKAS